MQLKAIEAVSVVHQIRCDRCGKEALRDEPGFAEMTSVGFDAGYGSIFGDGNRVEIDLCEACLRAALGTWLRVRTPWDIGQMPQQDVAQAAEQTQPAAGGQDHRRFAHEYGVLTVEEMADRMKCTPEVVREREVAGDLFAARAPGRDDGPRYPAFQLHERLNKALLKQIIQEYRKWGASTTLLWSFLRSPQKIFGGLTPVEMMLGGSVPAFDALTPSEWSEAFLDVVSEELSRVTQ